MLYLRLSPEYRPIWWLKEFNSLHRLKGFNTDANTCDTSAGFPSSHAVTFTAFAFIVFHTALQNVGKYCQMGKTEKYILTHGLVSLPLGLVWCSRFYFLTEFLHQCIAGSLFAIAGVHCFHRYSSYLMKLSRWIAVIIMAGAGLIPLCVYYAMLHLGADPHWSVRMVSLPVLYFISFLEEETSKKD